MTAAPLIFQIITDAIFLPSYCLFMAPQLFVSVRLETAGHPSPPFSFLSTLLLSLDSHGTAVGSD